jgi:hypothetical protein
MSGEWVDSVVPWRPRYGRPALHANGRRQDDEEGDEVGKRHADPGVRLHAAELLLALFGSVFGRRFRGVRALVFHFFRGLPEEQIGADGGPEDRDDGGQRRPGQLKTRKEGRLENADPWDLYDEQDPDVGQESHAQPLQVGHIRELRQSGLTVRAIASASADPRRRSRHRRRRRSSASPSTETAGARQYIGSEPETLAPPATPVSPA